MKVKINLLLDNIYSVYFNYKVLPKNIAKQQPIWISRKSVIQGCSRGAILIDSKNINKHMVVIGYPWYAFGKGKQPPHLRVDENATLVFKGTAQISWGTIIQVFSGACLTFGDSFYCNADCSVACESSITVGSDSLWGWNVDLRDNDGHPITYLGSEERINPNQAISLGNHVWLASDSTLLKGAKISDNCVVATKSLVTKTFEEENVIIGGSPAKIIKHNINWQH